LLAIAEPRIGNVVGEQWRGNGEEKKNGEILLEQLPAHIKPWQRERNLKRICIESDSSPGLPVQA
jgi:hypothetical protein